MVFKNELELAEYKNINKFDTKTLVEKSLKLMEETGEVAEAVLSFSKSSGCEYKNKTKNDVVEECVDVIIVAKSIIAELESNTNNSSFTYSAKVDSWKEKNNYVEKEVTDKLVFCWDNVVEDKCNESWKHLEQYDGYSVEIIDRSHWYRILDDSGNYVVNKDEIVTVYKDWVKTISELELDTTRHERIMSQIVSLVNELGGMSKTNDKQFVEYCEIVEFLVKLKRMGVEE